jgi:hypothetical protein
VQAWVPRILHRIRYLAAAGRVRFTLKALRELAVLSLDADDAVEVLGSLSRIDAACRLRSARTGEWLYVFKPKVGRWIIYLKVALRDDCIVVSFHENEEDDDDPA